MVVRKPTLEIPVIDISGFLRGDEDAKKTCALELRSALENVGFFQICGHSVSTDLQKRFIQNIADFFALPQPEKDKIGQDKSPCNRGYEAIGVERLEEIEDNSQIEKKEGFTVRCERPLGRFMTGPNQWPDPSLPGMSDFRGTYMEYYSAMHQLSTSMFRLMALSLDLDEHFFDAFAADPDGESSLLSRVSHHIPNVGTRHPTLPITQVPCLPQRHLQSRSWHRGAHRFWRLDASSPR